MLIDVAAKQTTATIQNVGTGPMFVAAQPYQKRAFVISTDKLALIDTAQGQLLNTWPLPQIENKPLRGKGVAVSPDGQHVYVGAWLAGQNGQNGSGYILVYKPDGTLEQTVQAGINPATMSVSRNGRRLYVQDGNGPGYFLDLTQNNTRQQLPQGGPMLENDDGTVLFGAGVNQVWRAAVESWQPTILDSISSGGKMFVGMALSLDSRALYAAAFDLGGTNGALVAIDAKTGKVNKRLDLPGQGWNVACSLDGTKVFVTNRIDRVYVIDTTTWNLSQLPAGKGASGIIIAP
jgi:DNA-binding beta-propeller fold protein YncE